MIFLILLHHAQRCIYAATPEDYFTNYYFRRHSITHYGLPINISLDILSATIVRHINATGYCGWKIFTDNIYSRHIRVKHLQRGFFEHARTDL